MKSIIHISVQPNQIIKNLGDLYGIFFEDINHAADGGLYAEMVQNRSFEYDHADHLEYHALTAWERLERGQAITKLHVETSDPLNARNTHYLVMDVSRSGMGGVRNSGYHTGMHVRQGELYHFSCWYRLRSRHPVTVHVRLESADGTSCYTENSFLADKRCWTKIGLALQPAKESTEARLAVVAEEAVSLALDMISLFPENTFRHHRNGLRADLAQMLADMKPKFLRFPGGCIVHCGSTDPNDRESMYRWKTTLGSVEERGVWRNIWSYHQSLGLGFYEYFLLCEDIGAQPLPVIPGGWDPHSMRGADMADMQEWIDEALDLIEFANGGANTAWGKMRCDMGHPEPFHLKYLAVGNEEVGEEFFQRYALIHRAMQKKYPEIQIIASAGPGCNGTVFNYGWAQARELGAAYVDEHFYQSPEWFIANAHRYASYPAEGPQAFLGEYASRGDTWWNALAEAAFMLGMEKAPGLGMACYAPLLCNVDYVNWTPNLICFDQDRVYGTPSYYVQKLMMRHQGDREVAIETDSFAISKPEIRLAGEIAFTAENCDVSVSDLVITNTDTGEQIWTENFHLYSGIPEKVVAAIEWENYRVSFRAARHSDCDEKHHAGGCPFALEFARKDVQNKLRWIIDGWMSMTSIVQIKNGDFCELVTNTYPHCKDIWYHYVLEVHSDIINTAINGVSLPQTNACQAVLEPLYTAASLEENTGDLIVKIANLQAEDVETVLDLGGYKAKTVEIHQMAGFAKTDRNTLEVPEKVAPYTSTQSVTGEGWTFPAESLTILRFKQ